MKSVQIIVLGMLVVSGLLSAAVTPPETCSELPAAHQLDFSKYRGRTGVVGSIAQVTGNRGSTLI
jgi:hypothetical protein